MIGTGIVCYDNETCGENEHCDMNQGDFDNNTIGDACECYADANHDGKVIMSDLVVLKNEFGRMDCETPPPCQADANGDGQVGLSDLVIMKTQFGKTGCPVP